MIGSYIKGCISDFWLSGQSLIKENCYNSRTSADIDRDFGPVTKLGKRNKKHKKIDDGIKLANCDAIVILPIFDQFGAIRKPDSRGIVCKT